MHASRLAHLLALASLALAAAALHWPVLHTGFWSPEDFQQLEYAARMRSLAPVDFRPVPGGGYPLNPIFALEFPLFGLNPRPYYLVNLALHVLNAFLAYLLVNSLLHDKRSAFMAALLFALGVGSYGKNLMSFTGASSLAYAMACLLATLLYVLNEKRNAGRPVGWYAFGFFAILTASLFMRGGTFSIMVSFVFYNFFFRRERQRPVLHTSLLICLALAACGILLRLVHGSGNVVPPGDPGAFVRNLPGYLILMAFPLHQSQLLATAPAIVRGIYSLAPYIRVLVGLAILSYSLFGLVFGNRTVRFYIAWMYVMVVPFAFLRYPSDWLNLRFLYLDSVGFCVILTTGTLYAYKLLARHRLRRLVPFAIPAFYIFLSAALVMQLHHKSELLSRDSENVQRLARITSLLEQ